MGTQKNRLHETVVLRTQNECSNRLMRKYSQFTLNYIYLEDNCIQNFYLGRYIVGYTVGNLVLRRRVISERISDDIPPQMKILNMVIPILMHYQHFPFIKAVKMYFFAPIRPATPAAYIHLSTNEKRRYVMTSGFRQYIAGYTVANL